MSHLQSFTAWKLLRPSEVIKSLCTPTDSEILSHAFIVKLQMYISVRDCSEQII